MFNKSKQEPAPSVTPVPTVNTTPVPEAVVVAPKPVEVVVPQPVPAPTPTRPLSTALEVEPGIFQVPGGYKVKDRDGVFDLDTARRILARDTALEGYRPQSSGLVTQEFLDDPMYSAFKMAAAQGTGIAYMWILNHTDWYQANSLRVREDYFKGDNQKMAQFLQDGDIQSRQQPQ